MASKLRTRREGEIADAPRTLTRDEATAIYDVLIADARARDTEAAREDFVRYSIKSTFVEWRFMGRLRFGGKLYFDGYSIPHVGYYREDETPEREGIVARTNARLTALFATASPNPTETHKGDGR